jgi:small subunit ribosomal protein S17
MSLSNRKIKICKVVSDKMDETVVVASQRRLPHPKYKKPVRRQSKFRADDPGNKCSVGDVVRIIETRPMSKTKRWRVLDILVREEDTEVRPEDVSRGSATAIMSEIVPGQDSTTSTTETQILPLEPTESSKSDSQQTDTNDESITKPKRKAKTEASDADDTKPETTTEKEAPVSKDSATKPKRKAKTEASGADDIKPETTTEKEAPVNKVDSEEGKK